MSDESGLKPQGTCPRQDCKAEISRIERYGTTVVWEKEPDGSWDTSAFDADSHFHLFCSKGHESKAWPEAGHHEDFVVPNGLLPVIFMGNYGDSS